MNIRTLNNISPLQKRAGIISVRADKEGSPTVSFGIIFYHSQLGRSLMGITDRLRTTARLKGGHGSCEDFVVSHSYLCIWVNCCSIISQVIIYLKVLKRWVSILNLALFCLTLPVALLAVDLSPFQSFMLCVAQHLELLYSFSPCLRLNLPSFLLLNTSSHSARCRLVSVAIFAALVCSTPRVDLLVVDLSRQSRQSVSTFRAFC